MSYQVYHEIYKMYKTTEIKIYTLFHQIINIYGTGSGICICYKTILLSPRVTHLYTNVKKEVYHINLFSFHVTRDKLMISRGLQWLGNYNKSTNIMMFQLGHQWCLLHWGDHFHKNVKKKQKREGKEDFLTKELEIETCYILTCPLQSVLISSFKAGKSIGFLELSLILLHIPSTHLYF